jgi:Fe-S-cluster-containing hydrogenase component 2
MPPPDRPFDLGPVLRDADEGLFGRDIDGQLVRLDVPTEGDYGKQVTLTIDGRSVTVPMAEPLKDAQGNIVLDLEGRTTPRYTTIYDAATKAYEEHRDEQEQPQPGGPAGATGPGWREFPIPVLCHQPHMKPVAVCRVCVVQIYGQFGGKRAPERRLLPACQHQVKDGMEVFTMYAPGPDGERVRRSVRVVTELLTSDHLKLAVAPAPAQELAPFNELGRVADRCGLSGSRFATDVLATRSGAAGAAGPALDDSSPVFLVDKSACILCDRCVRACDEVKQNHIIGRSGKGRTARIGFDLDVPMGHSDCVQCGECMVSCPTTAITFKPVARVKPPAGARAVEVLHAAELARDPLLAGVPPKFLLWQEGLVVRRRLKAGEVVCREGEPGNTAFFIKSGRLEIRGTGSANEPPRRVQRGPADVIVGEMACLSGTPRTADVVAVEDGEVWEVRRNVLDRIMRSPTQRARFETIYRESALEAGLRSSVLFQGLPADEYLRCIEFLKPRLSFLRASPGQVIFQQGDLADNLYLIRLGHVRVAISQFGREASVFFSGPGSVIGEIGLLAISTMDADKGADEIDRSLGALLAQCQDRESLARAFPAGRRTARCSALDHVEMARIGRTDFLEMIREFARLRQRLIRMSVGRLQEDSASASVGEARREYVRQGLYQAQSLLVLDLNSCTRCDQCTQACTQQHGTESHGVPFTRLLREGLRFSQYLVATSCRSCKDAYCMIGCPVDSIHRGRHGQIVIESHCIGCGLCANNCPYGNIFMMPNQLAPREVPDLARPGQMKLVAQPKAATCDLCDAEGHRATPLPRCVYACPHEAAMRLTGRELLARVTGISPEPEEG